MKNKNTFPECIYRDEGFEQKTKSELQKAEEALQKLLDVWNSLDLAPLHTTLFELAYNPQKVHGASVSEVAEMPIVLGKFQLKKDVFLNILDIPVPDQLYRAARECRSHSWTGVPELWSVMDGKTVIMDLDLADSYIYANSVFIENEAQKEIADHVIKYVEISNYLHSKYQELQGMGSQFGIPYTLVERGFPFTARLQLEPIQLRELLKSL